MLRFAITVHGSRAVANNLRRTAANAPKAAQNATYEWAQGVRRILKSTPYPAKRPGQKYIRTGRLANSWAVERGGKTDVAIVNRAAHKGGEYSRFVVGDGGGKGQAWMHKGRWYVARNTIDKERPELTRMIRQAIARQSRGGRTG